MVDDDPAGTPDTHRAAVRGAARNSAWGAVGAAIAAVLGFMLSVVVARVAGAHNAGLFFAGVAIVMISISVCTIGADTGLLRSLSRDRAVEDSRNLRALLRVGLLPVLGLAVLSGSLLVVFAPAIASTLTGSNTEPATTLLQVAGIGVILGPLSQCLLQATRGLGDVRPFVLLQQVGLPSVRVIAVVALAVAGVTSAPTLLAAWAVPFALSLLLAALAVRRRVLRHERAAGILARPVTRATASDFWRFAAPRGLGGICSQGLLWSDVLIVAVLASPTVAAIYAAASRLATGGQIAIQAMRLGIAPQISAAFASGHVERVSALYRASTTWAVLLSWPIFLTLALFPGVALSLFGPEFVAAETAMRILSVAMMVSVAVGNVGTVLLMSGHSGWSARNSALALGANVALNIVLVPLYGATGAAISWTAAIMVENVLGLWLVRYRLKVIGHGQRFWVTIVLVVLVLSSVGLISGATVDGDLAAMLVHIGVSGALLGIVYGIRRMR